MGVITELQVFPNQFCVQAGGNPGLKIRPTRQVNLSFSGSLRTLLWRGLGSDRMDGPSDRQVVLGRYFNWDRSRLQTPRPHLCKLWRNSLREQLQAEINVKQAVSDRLRRDRDKRYGRPRPLLP